MPLPALVDPLLGSDLSVVTIQNLIYSGGAWVPSGTLFSLMDTVKSVENEAEVGTANIKPVWRKADNNVPISYGESMSLECIARSLSANTLTKITRPSFNTYLRYRVSFVAGTETIYGDFLFQRRSNGVTSDGENSIRAQFVPIDNGNADNNNMVYSSTA